MFSAKWILPIACVSSGLLAQSATDLNGLVSAAAHYVSSGVSGGRSSQALDLHKVTGTYGEAAPDVLMTKAADVQRWLFQYRIDPSRAETPDPDGKPARHVAAQAQCDRGIFNGFKYLDQKISGTKSLEYTWVAVPLDTAINQLNLNGYVQGFTKVEVLRPDLPGWSDEMVYLFNCPLERREVAISCQTGALAWSYGY
jgi:hypothetical protein